MSLDEAEFIERAMKIRRRLYCAAYSILWNDADCLDAMQEAAAKAWMGLSRLRNEAYFETWLTRILINECKALVRKRRDESALTDEISSAQQDIPGDIDLRKCTQTAETEISTAADTALSGRVFAQGGRRYTGFKRRSRKIPPASGETGTQTPDRR